MKNYILLFVGFLGLISLKSCSERKEISSESLIDIRGNYVVDLFPKEEKVIFEEDKKLTYEEAFSESELVLYATDIQKLGNSYARGIKKFYLYQVKEGYIKKSPKKFKSNNKILFISNEDLFTGDILKDSVYLFLTPLADYKLLKNHSDIQYSWLEKAPLLTK
ncbi:hypothetical protein ACILPE_09830 [Capnocytophaga canimorsus]|uniref:Uncharacterized protein n=1 Tax=Capnocytophaga canis TaxID=1848903 RepID=A0A3A1YCU9_9FLAO|nr:hypothetical protein [Capnocytophaga canis]RIY35049.1 hypothetical protein CKY20_11440 [Capnocytophaga canis]